MTHWLDRGADAWRLDAAYAVPAEFWQRVLPAVRAAHPDVWVMGEVIHGDYPGYVTTSGVDSVTQYELWKALWSSVVDANFFELAWALERGMQVGDVRLKWAAVLAFLGYVLLYIQYRLGQPLAGFCYLQQTLLSVAFTGLISATLDGFGGWLGKTLDAAPAQHLGRLSYGFYLFHSPAPLLLGHIMPFLWAPYFDGPWQIIRLITFGLTSWGLAYLCWRYLETGPQFSSKRAYANSPSR